MSRVGLLLVALGLAVAVTAGLLAPPQPELIPSGGACQLAPCGTLEDPPVWRAMWWLLGLGALAAAVGAVAVVAGLPPGEGWPSVGRWVVGLLLGLVLWALVLLAAPVVGLVSSAQLAVAVLLAGTLLVVALVGVVLGGGARATRRTALAAIGLSAPAPLLVASVLLRG